MGARFPISHYSMRITRAAQGHESEKWPRSKTPSGTQGKKRATSAKGFRARAAGV
jgi:hypothetical protein